MIFSQFEEEKKIPEFREGAVRAGLGIRINNDLQRFE